jgi:GNAT superfamily N-acetyltransferase
VSRYPVLVRDAVPEDAAGLVEVWSEFRRAGSDRTGRAAERDAASSLARIAADPDERLLVAVVDDEVVGAVHLTRAGISPIHTETAIHVTHLHVLGGHRRHGVGKALMEAAVSWAEEKDTAHVIAAAPVSSRDANRFMARLGLSPLATIRGAAVPLLRAKLPVEPPAGAMVNSRNHRSVGQVIAQRRLQRRAQSKAE